MYLLADLPVIRVNQPPDKRRHHKGPDTWAAHGDTLWHILFIMFFLSCFLLICIFLTCCESSPPLEVESDRDDGWEVDEAQAEAAHEAVGDHHHPHVGRHHREREGGPGEHGPEYTNRPVQEERLFICKINNNK